MPEAARVGDAHDCPHADGNHPHRGGPIEAPASTSVVTAHRPQARAGDRCHCDGPPDFIVTGSESVYVDGRPAARRGDHTMHNPAGTVREGSASVHIGGRTAGATLGGGGVTSQRACEQAARGRARGSTMQSWGNCGVESVRQLVNLTRGEHPIDETAMLNDVIAHDEARPSSDPARHGTSNAYDNQSTLQRYGVAAGVHRMSFDEVLRAVAEGRGVITAHDTSVLWGPGHSGSHAVLVTGAVYDAEGRLTHVVINDTGAGRCSDNIPTDVFTRALLPVNVVLVTEHPVWRRL